MKITSDIVCTLFEGDYHYGVAALCDSLIGAGFSGKVFAGYRGPCPNWFNPEGSRHFGEFSSKYAKVGNVELHLVPLETDYHLTNYKPDFMLKVAQGVQDWESLFYFDPDIVITRKWAYFRSWTQSGVCLCEDINSPKHEHHPNRDGWRNYFLKYGYSLRFKSSAYVNGGCIGVTRANLDFLEEWVEIQIAMGDAIGGLSVSDIGRPSLKEAVLANDESQIFKLTDQDALNATIEYTENKCSILGQEAMSFKHGLNWMAHALGSKKPWRRKYLFDMLQAIPPSSADKAFWTFVSSSFRPYGSFRLISKKLALAIAAFVGRFYRRG